MSWVALTSAFAPRGVVPVPVEGVPEEPLSYVLLELELLDGFFWLEPELVAPAPPDWAEAAAAPKSTATVAATKARRPGDKEV